MKVLVFGSRNFTDYELVKTNLLSFNISHLISGGATGVDSIAEKFATEINIPKTIIKPNYQKFGKSAPIIRNKEMANLCDYAIAFWDGKSPGTKFTINYCKELNKPIHILMV